MEKCIYCGISFNPTKGVGDHIIPVQLGEFRNDTRFRRICTSCNNKIGRSEQQFLLCGPESFFRSLVNPKIPKKRQRGRSQIKAVMGMPSPESTIDHGDHRQLVKRSIENPKNVFPLDQIVIHNDKGEEFFIKLFAGMKQKQLKDLIEKLGITKIDKLWVHCDDQLCSEFQQLLTETWPKSKIHSLPGTEAGITQISGRITFKVNDHYFRTLAKIAFHHYLIHSRRCFRGNEQCFGPIRDFIMNGGNNKDFFNQSGPKFVVPFGEIPSGGVITPKQWCHIIAADETYGVVVVYLQLFVGDGCIPHPYYIRLANMDSKILVSNSTWGHVFLYDELQGSDRYAGEVKEAQITRIR